MTRVAYQHNFGEMGDKHGMMSVRRGAAHRNKSKADCLAFGRLKEPTLHSPPLGVAKTPAQLQAAAAAAAADTLTRT
ncbi:hypothetical protein EYF80_013349 [Liparis tanakae]|uniref:Uncharacterized protein n=1 Tax=Liparis tanakae TaxID=230148 RepID=A0A4Z2IGD2_9TELE|nr:hypothetical protein EYF80_013349 [Liparis tanakae]